MKKALLLALVALCTSCCCGHTTVHDDCYGPAPYYGGEVYEDNHYYDNHYHDYHDHHDHYHH